MLLQSYFYRTKFGGLQGYVAPPSCSVRLLAQQFGGSCAIRFSRRSFSGLVVTVSFRSHHQPTLGPARQFAALAARLAGYPCALRRLSGYSGFVVSVPVAPWSPVRLQPKSAPAAVVIQPVAPVRCIAYLASGQPCARRATRGHYCGIHAKQVL